MDNYDEIARQAVKNITGFPANSGANILNYNNAPLYECAYEAAKLQAERFNDDLDASYIKYLESQKQYKDEEELI